MDEAQARGILDGMWERLARGPLAALGVDGTASVAEVHAAFGQLAKIYHPAKFARMSTEIQKLSNETFLQLRSAYDSATKAAKANRAAAAPPANGRGTGGSPVARPPVPATGLRATGPVPQLARTPASSQSLPRGAVPGTKAPTPATGVRVGALPSRPGGPATKLPSGAIPTVRNEEADYAAAKDAVARNALQEAHATLEALVAQSPSDRNRALHAYVRGRLFLAGGQREDAREALFDAKDLDPSLGTIVDAALAEVQRRRS